SINLSADSLRPLAFTVVMFAPKAELVEKVAPNSSNSDAIWVADLLAVPWRIKSAVKEAKPGISLGSERAPDLIHKKEETVGSLCCSITSKVRPLGSWTSLAWGSFTFRISWLTGTRFKR